MEILYIYLDKFRNFTRQGFNFSPEFNFNTELTDTETKITITKNDEHIPNFFNNESIVNVSAVIGQNGAGKSNILEFVRNELAPGQGGIKVDRVVAIKTIENDGKPNFRLYVADNLPIQILDTTKVFTKAVLHSTETSVQKGTLETFDEIDAFNEASIIFYSNHLDLRFTSSLQPLAFESELNPSTSADFYNISTLAMLSRDQQNYTAENYRVVEEKAIDKIDAYKVREIGRNIDFISQPGNHNLLGFQLPDSLVITIQSEDERQISKYKKVRNELFVFLENYKDEFEVKNLDGQKFINLLCRAILFNFFNNNLDLSDFPYSSEYLDSKKGTSFFEFFRTFFKTIAESGKVKSEVSRAGHIVELVEYLAELLVKEYDRFLILENNKGAIRLPVSFDKRSDTIKFINLYVNSKGYGDYLSFQWRGLSTGEQSMLTLLSRLFTLSDLLVPPNLKLKQHLIILIDEGDVYFHPEWQRKYLQLLLTFLPNIFQGRTMQLILTSNTPYLASDLPKSHITFLKKDKKDNTKVLNPDNDRKETFASNIHTLLADSFFLEDGLIGEFARQRVNAIIDFIKDDKGDTTRKEEYKKTIDLIGEPVIKNRIKELWVEKFGLSEEIEFLQKRLDELDRLQKAKDNDKN